MDFLVSDSSWWIMTKRYLSPIRPVSKGLTLEKRLIVMITSILICTMVHVPLCFLSAIHIGVASLSPRITYQCVVEDLNMLNISLCTQCRGNIYSRFSSNSEALASELIENLEEMFPRHLYIRVRIINKSMCEILFPKG